jgi:hypothetical protein
MLATKFHHKKTHQPTLQEIVDAQKRHALVLSKLVPKNKI